MSQRFVVWEMRPCSPTRSLGFHVQQAAEKLFKAWLALLGETYPMTHDLTELLEMLTSLEPDAARFDVLIDYGTDEVGVRCHVALPLFERPLRVAWMTRLRAPTKRPPPARLDSGWLHVGSTSHVAGRGTLPCREW